MQIEPRRGSPTFAWETVVSASVLKITFRGELDLPACEECSAGLEEPLAGPERVVLIDLQDVTFIDSTGLRLLIHLKQRTESDQKQLLLARVPEPVLKLLELTGMTGFFEQFDGTRPLTVSCPECDREIATDLTRCPSCGSAI